MENESMRHAISGMVLWIFGTSIAIGDGDTAKAIGAVLDEKTAAYSTAYADTIAKQIEAAKQAESKLKDLVIAQANKPGEKDAIKARDDATEELKRLEALQEFPKDLGANFGDLQRELKDLRARNEEYKKADVKHREEMSLLRTQVVKAEARGRELKAEVDRLGKQVEKMTLVREFEAIEDRDGWWWQDRQKPVKKGWYRVDRKQQRLICWDEENGQQFKNERYCATYEVMGVDQNDQNILLIELIYPPQGAKPGDRDVVRFNRKTGFIETSYGWYGEPKKKD
jgi:hypothetical protein